MSLETELRGEIERWSKRLDESMPKTLPSDDRGTKLLTNLRAYRTDSKHFLESGDLVKSFECLVWAWALLELGKELGHLKKI